MLVAAPEAADSVVDLEEAVAVAGLEASAVVDLDEGHSTSAMAGSYGLEVHSGEEEEASYAVKDHSSEGVWEDQTGQ